jgi:hypothetical protein
MLYPAVQLDALGYYASKLQRLRVDRAHEVATHKPGLFHSKNGLEGI